MTRITTTLSLLALLTAALPAQDAASTLVRLAERSTDVVKARVLNVRTVGARRLATFKVQESLHGRLAGRIEIDEPAGHACGRALLGVVTGATYVLFMDSSSAKPRLTISSSRSVLSLNSEVLGHLKALLRAKDAKARTELLSHVLNSRHPRIRRDAAHALAVRPGLETASIAFRSRVEESLGRALQTDTRAVVPLLRAAQRLRLRSAAPALVSAYLENETPVLAPMLRNTIVALDRVAAVATIERSMPSDPVGRTRALALLANCGSHADDCLKRIAVGRDRSAAIQAERILAERETAGPRFRGIRPHVRTRSNR